MAITNDEARRGNDAKSMSVSPGEQCQARVAALLRAWADLGPAKRPDDLARFTRMETEVIRLLDAALIRTPQLPVRES
jgi:hypothetical protein